MPNKRACYPCKYPEVQSYMDRRLGEGADLKTIRHELATPYRRRQFGYTTPPTEASLIEHQTAHRGRQPVSPNLPTFAGTSSATPDEAKFDVASVIQREALAMLERGEMRITAHHALKSQEILDRRAEKAKDRELTHVLARLMTMQRQPPKALIAGDDTIEGQYEEVELGTADD
jgi:hypothetical protein